MGFFPKHILAIRITVCDIQRDILASDDWEGFEEQRDAMKEGIPRSENLVSHWNHSLDRIILGPPFYSLLHHRPELSRDVESPLLCYIPSMVVLACPRIGNQTLTQLAPQCHKLEQNKQTNKPQ